MVKNSEFAHYSAAQSMALAMLGYYRWLPRVGIASYPKTNAIAPIVKTSREISSATDIAPQLISPVVETITQIPKKQPLLINLGNTGATLNICRDYVIISAENLPCVFLLPPLWANDEGLHCFATSIEKTLWLNAWQSLDIPIVTNIFSALFAVKIPIQFVPEFPLKQTLIDNKPIVCVGMLNGLEMPHNKVRFDLTHPWFLMQKPLTKKTFWLELLALKEKLF